MSRADSGIIFTSSRNGSPAPSDVGGANVGGCVARVRSEEREPAKPPAQPTWEVPRLVVSSGDPKEKDEEEYTTVGAKTVVLSNGAASSFSETQRTSVPHISEEALGVGGEGGRCVCACVHVCVRECMRVFVRGCV